MRSERSHAIYNVGWGEMSRQLLAVSPVLMGSPALSKSSSGLSNSGSHCINPVGSKQDSVDALQSGGCPVDFS